MLYVSKLKGLDWFPQTYVYHDEYSQLFRFFNRLFSRKHFEKIKAVLALNDIAELKQSIQQMAATAQWRGYDRGHSAIPPISQFIAVDDIGSSL
jgi:hypothetical protein